MGTSVVPAPAESEGLSAVQRIINVFFAPSKTFRDLKRDSSWWIAWLLIGLSSILFAFAVQQKIGFAQVFENTMRMSPKQAARLESASPEQQEKARGINEKVTMVRAYARPIFGLIGAAILAGILLGVFNFGLGAEVPYSVSLAIVIYSGLPGLAKNLLSTITLFVGVTADGFMMDNPLGSNLGFYLDPAKSVGLYSIGSALDIFTVWTLLLLAIGFSSVTKLKLGTTFTVLAVLYCLFALVAAGAASLFL